MSGCEGCFTSPRGQQEALERIKTKAKVYATENQKAVAIYQEAFEFLFCEATVAIEHGYRIIEVVSGDY